jgi:RHS repeat-associated protein
VTSTVSVYPLPVAWINGAVSSPSTTYYNNFGYGQTLSTSTFYYSYTWQNNGVDISPAVTTSSYLPTLPGVYRVKVVGTSGGPIAYSTVINISEPGVQGDSVNSVSQTLFYKSGLNGTSSPYTLQPNDLVQKINFTDGLGRGVQTIGVGQSPANGDIVIPTVPGHSGLTDSTFLPYATSSVQGSFRHNAVRGSAAVTSYNTSEQYNFYQGTSKVASDGNPFARVVFRNTPDARVVEQGAPGTAWQPGSAHTVINKMTLSTSTSYPVLLWKADGTTTGYYPDNTVWVTRVTDENSHRVNVYKNKLGQTVLKQVRADNSTWLLTYYIYDVYGQLIYQIPPKAMSVLGGGTSLNANSASVADLIYTYTYDARGRLVQKKVPGSGVAYTVYDQLDRAVLTQDANQRAQGVWMFVKYDFKNRPVYIGQMASASDRPTWQSQFDAINYGTQPYFETRAVNATYQGYTNNVSPTSGLTVLGAYYYDDYDFDNNGAADYTYDNTHLTGIPSSASTAIRGLPTGSKKLILGTTNWLVTAKFYDNLDRPLQTQSNNHLNLVVQDKTSVLYFANNLSNKVQKIKSTHTGTAVVTVTQRYTYDNGWRPTGVYHTINTNAEQQVAAYQYNALGQMVMKQLHNTGAAFMQNVDMRYNIRGWLTSINNAQLANDGITNNDSNDYFGMELFYNTSEASGLGNSAYFNGNISAIKWKNGGVALGATDQRSYMYSYDSCDRLLSAVFQANSGTAWNKETSTLNETMTYDANGNIATLMRNQNQRGLSGTTITSAGQAIDNLTYTYATGNQMSKVEDAVAAGPVGNLGFLNGSTATTEYTYDTNGNMTADANKGVDSIKYNVLGKPVRVKFHDGRLVTYLYDAAGTKLKTNTTISGTTTTADYVNNFVYSNALLSFFSSPEGRVVKNGSNYEYQYAIADHLGNTRVVFTSAAQTATPTIATFEGDANDQQSQFTSVNQSNVVPYTAANHTSGGSKVVRMNQTYPVGPSWNTKVFAGDKVDMEVYAYYEPTSGFGSSNAPLTSMITSVATAFGGVMNAPDYTGQIYNGVNSALSNFGLGSNPGDTQPSAYLNYILFDQSYRVVDMGWTAVPSSANFAKQRISIPTVTAKEAGFIFVYLSYEDLSNNWVYFDDFKVTFTPTSILQSNEYYPFGLQTANSWTRTGAVANNFLANGATELNTTTQVYDLDWRNYDPILGRLNQVDLMADKYGSLSPYHFSFNNPVGFNDPSGLSPITDGTWFPGDPMPGAGDQQRNIGGGGGQIRWDGSGGYYQDSNGNGVQDNGEQMVSEQEAAAAYGVKSITDPNKIAEVLNWINNQIATTAQIVLSQNGVNYMYNFGLNAAGAMVYYDRTRSSQSSSGGWYGISDTYIGDLGGYGAFVMGDRIGNESDFIYKNNDALGLALSTIEPGFGAAWDVVRAAPGAYTASAKVLAKGGGIALVGLNVALTGYTLYSEKQDGTFDTHSIVNGAVTVVGVGLTITGLVISAPVVAVIGAGVGIGYGIAQVAGIDGWIDSNWSLKH